MDLIKKFSDSLESTGDYSTSTLRSYAADLRRFEEFLKSELNGTVSGSIFPAGIFNKFLDAEEDNGFKPRTIHRRKVALTQFAEYLCAQGMITRDKVAAITNHKQDIWKKINQRDLTFLTEDQCIQLENAILREKNSRVYRDISIISLLLETGLTINPIVGLNLFDIDLRAERIKANNGFQTIRYSIPESVGFLTEYLKSSRRELTQSITEEALFVSQMGGRITRQGVWQILKGWGDAAKLPVPLSPRVLRHTAVRRMLRANQSVEEIQRLLGHSNIMSTRALIRKLSKNEELKTMEVISNE